LEEEMDRFLEIGSNVSKIILKSFGTFKHPVQLPKIGSDIFKLIKSSRVISCVSWLKFIDVSGTISVPIIEV
jgi:hypothetical protein